jgi:predicted CoA-binding protein
VPARPTVAILGASSDRQKYGNKSLRAHLQQGYDVYPVNPRATEIEGLKSYPNLAAIPVARLDRISIYLPPAVGIGLLPEIKARGAKEVWLNPGSESPELLAEAEKIGLDVIQACSIVDVGMSPAQL